jgi:ubiquinone/menaquinone biosynthesis C-methylase UbiE
MGSSDIQGKLWGVETQDYIEFIEPSFKPLWEAMLVAASVEKDTRFLDVGCGCGGASILVSNLRAVVTGLDASEAFIKTANKRVPNGEFRVGDMEQLPFENNSFDVSFSSQTLMFADDPGLAIREMKRVTVPNGRVVIGIWGAIEDCELESLGKAIRDNLPKDVLSKLPPKRQVSSLSDHGFLEKLIEQADLKILDSKDLEHCFEFNDFECCWRGLKSTGPVQGVMRIAGEENFKTVVQKAIESLWDRKGAIRLENRVRYVLASEF